MSGRNFLSQRGDTIVEVMFAIAVFAFVAVTSLAIMGSGLSTTQRTLEITQVRQAMNDQAELLRYLQQSALGNTASPTNKGAWSQISSISPTNGQPSVVTTTASPFGLAAGNVCQATGSVSKPFVLFPSGGNITVETGAASNVMFANGGSSAYPRIQVNGGGAYQGTYGLWIEAVQASATQNFVDYNIRTCWNAPGSGVPITLGTIVRLYI